MKSLEEYIGGSGEWHRLLKMMENPDVSELQVNNRNSIWIRYKGQRTRVTDVEWFSEEDYMHSIKKSLAESGIVKSDADFDPRGALFEGPIEFIGSDGKGVKGRVHIVLPPVSPSPLLTLAKKSTSLIDLDSIAKSGSMSLQMLRFMKAAIYSNLSIIFSGGTGAGKDLHRDTLIPTPDGLRTVDDIEVGDVIYDDRWEKTEVLRKYSPHDPRHFELSFSDGTVVKAGMGHLWRTEVLSEPIEDEDILFSEEEITLMKSVVSEGVDEVISWGELLGYLYRSPEDPLNDALRSLISGYAYRLGFDDGVVGADDEAVYDKREVFDHLLTEHAFRVGGDKKQRFHRRLMTTEEISESGLIDDAGGYRYGVSLSAADDRRILYITGVDEISDDGGDYFCFSVDAPSRMFLCGEAGIPTHNTTILEACTKLFPDDERIAVCEDTPELVLTQDNVAYQHSFPWRPGMDTNDAATLSWIVQQVNRMRTDRVIVGETRGKEFADFLIAANSGMEGSLTTIHANDPRTCLSKMTNFALRGAGENVPIRSINEDIANTVDLVVQLNKKAGRYYMTKIEEITNTVSNTQSAEISTQTLWYYDEESEIHRKDMAMTNGLRRKLRNKGIDDTEFVNAAYMGEGTEPAWLPGFAPRDAAPRADRTIQPEKKLHQFNESVEKEKRKETEKQQRGLHRDFADRRKI